jgi:glycerol uptake facilitator-like aquaporin
MRAVAAELIGTAALLAAVVGSGIMGQRLSPSNLGVALLANALATGFVLYVLVTALAPVSRAHFNPVVTLAAVINREFAPGLALVYVAAQCIGAVAGVWLAHAMFDLPLLQASSHSRTGIGQWVSEAVATAGLLLTIGGFTQHASKQVAAAVAVYIAAAYWFTASTSFANPAVTMARSLTDTFAGIRPVDVAPFILSQLIGMATGLALVRMLFGRTLVEPISIESRHVTVNRGR